MKKFKRNTLGKIVKLKTSHKVKKTVKDQYLNKLKAEYDDFSNQLKKLKKKLLKADGTKDQEKIIKEIDLIAKKIENNQKQSIKVTKTRFKKLKTRK